MNKHLLVAIGGTGQVALHFYTQLFLLGRVPAFDAMVLDVDSLLPSLQRMGDLFDEVRPVLPATHLPSISYLKPAAPTGETVAHALQGGAVGARFHPSQVFFSGSELAQKLGEGLFARPALSALVRLPRELEAIVMKGRERVITVSSTIGGTGGGLTAPTLAMLADRISKDGAHMARLRSVLFGPYFNPDEDKLQDATERFPSNALLIAETLRRLSPATLHSYCYITDANAGARDTAAERQPNIPWPTAASPVWRGVNGMVSLATDSVRDNQETFETKQVSESNELSAETCSIEIAARVRLVDTLVRRRSIGLLPKDPMAKVCWGPAFPSVVRQIISVSQRAFPQSTPSSVAAEVDSGVREMWADLRSVFPNRAAKVHATPADVVRTRWQPDMLQLDRARGMLENQKDFSRLCAAALLVTILRGAVNVGQAD